MHIINTHALKTRDGIDSDMTRAVISPGPFLPPTEKGAGPVELCPLRTAFCVRLHRPAICCGVRRMFCGMGPPSPAPPHDPLAFGLVYARIPVGPSSLIPAQRGASIGQVWTRHLAPAAPASRPSSPSQFHDCPCHADSALQFVPSLVPGWGKSRAASTGFTALSPSD